MNDEIQMTNIETEALQQKQAAKTGVSSPASR